MVQLAMQMHPDGHPEWFMMELQGDLETKSDATSLSGKFIGDLHFTTKGEAIMIIGHHILHGKMAKLEKPFAVLEKGIQRGQREEDMDTDDKDVDCVDTTDYMVKAVVKKKLIFKTRPKPIIANVPKKI